jgi:hypothetical protein
VQKAEAETPVSLVVCQANGNPPLFSGLQK